MLQLQRDFNKTMASNAVLSVAQGRSGATVTAIGEAAEAQLNWDKDFTRLNTVSQVMGYMAQAEQADIAASAKKTVGTLSAIGSGLSSAGTSLYSIGGSSQ